jgi:hypothetical protein
MNYFTPELLKRFNSRDDDIADTAHKESEQAIRAYKEHFDKIREKLPEDVRRLLRSFYLHDAKLESFLIGERVVSIFVRPEADGDVLLMLRYLLAGPARLSGNWRRSKNQPPLEWLYDEFDVRQKRGSAVFTHSILFTDDRELQLDFSDMVLDTYQVVVSPQNRVTREQRHGLDALLTNKSGRWTSVSIMTVAPRRHSTHGRIRKRPGRERDLPTRSAKVQSE